MESICPKVKGEEMKQVNSINGGKWWEDVFKEKYDGLQNVLSKFVKCLNLKDLAHLDRGLPAMVFKIFVLLGMDNLHSLKSEVVEEVMADIFTEDVLVTITYEKDADNSSVDSGIRGISMSKPFPIYSLRTRDCMKLFKILDKASHLEIQTVIDMLNVIMHTAFEMLPLASELFYCYTVRCPDEKYWKMHLTKTFNKALHGRECMLGMLIQGSVLCGDIRDTDATLADRITKMLQYESELCYKMQNTIVGGRFLLKQLCQHVLEKSAFVLRLLPHLLTRCSW